MAFSPETYALLAGKGGGGSGGGGSSDSPFFYIENQVSDDSEVLDKTWIEIYNAVKSGKLPVIRNIVEEEGYKGASIAVIDAMGSEEGNTYVGAEVGNNYSTWEAASENDYPQITWD